MFLGLLRNIQGWDYRGRRDCQELGLCPSVLFSCANFTHAKPHSPFPLLSPPPRRINLMEGMSRYTVFPGWNCLLAGRWLDLSRAAQRSSSSGDGKLSVRVFSFTCEVLLPRRQFMQHSLTPDTPSCQAKQTHWPRHAVCTHASLSSYRPRDLFPRYITAFNSISKSVIKEMGAAFLWKGGRTQPRPCCFSVERKLYALCAAMIRTSGELPHKGAKSNLATVTGAFSKQETKESWRQAQCCRPSSVSDL